MSPGTVIIPLHKAPIYFRFEKGRHIPFWMILMGHACKRGLYIENKATLYEHSQFYFSVLEDIEYNITITLLKILLFSTCGIL